MAKRIWERYKVYTCSECRQQMSSMLIKPYTRICYDCWYKYENPYTPEEMKKIRKFVKSLQSIGF